MALLLAACGLREVVPPEGPLGPTLVVEVTNRSDHDVAVGYSFESPGTSGEGQALSSSCRREALRFGPMGGQYVISVDEKRITTGDLSDRLDPNGFLVLRVWIHENGGVEVGGSLDSLEQAPQTDFALNGCGAG
jgi:hypothetical protein